MSDYTQSIDFSDKDALPAGNPGKLGRGADIDTELGLISVAIASKEDETNKNVANGYAGLDASAFLLAARFPAMTGDVTNTAGTVATTISNNVVSNAKLADVATATIKGRSAGGTGDPEDLTVAQVIALLNTGTGLSASIVTTGTLPNSVVAQGNVTQHQSALTIAETQISDGAVLARLAADEVVTGSWRMRGITDECLRIGGQGIAAENPLISFYNSAGTRRGYIQAADAGPFIIQGEGTTSSVNIIASAGVFHNLQTAWSAGNDGAGSGLDADLLDGSQGSFYRDASNLNAGSVPNAQISQGSVTQHQAALAITGPQLSTNVRTSAGATSVSSTDREGIILVTATGNVTLPDGHGFSNGQSVAVMRDTSGAVSFVVSGAQTMEAPGSRFSISEENGWGVATLIATNRWAITVL